VKLNFYSLHYYKVHRIIVLLWLKDTCKLNFQTTHRKEPGGMTLKSVVHVALTLLGNLWKATGSYHTYNSV
ncbi:hypothetical protein L9F63_003111, partial [Diploptera punctata]